jgi:[protein-PII] uridylyltransferase
VLGGDGVDLHALIRRQQPARPLYQANEGERLATHIAFDNEISEKRTALEIETEDRVGLLYVISQALAAEAVDISAAKIFTEKGAAMDTFYVSELDGGQVADPARQRVIEFALRTAIAALDGN